jgi:histone deacetylase 6
VKNHGLKRVLIVDWDIHHGNGTQHIFENDPKVLYISIHRYDHGNFFPRSKDADFIEVGSEAGRGFTVNIPWNKKGMGDMEYVLAMQNIILPIAYEFDPELVLISAGFDAAIGDQLGGCKVTPEAYGHFTHWLATLANGRIILVLEGGYNVNSISHAMTMCTKALLGDPLPSLQISSRFNGINSSALLSLQNVVSVQQEFWKSLKFNKKLPDYDVNENKVGEDELVKCMTSMKLNTTPPSDADDSGSAQHSGDISSYSDDCVAGPSTSNVATSSEKKQTLTDFLNDNLEALNNEEMYAIVPLKSCPHLALLNPDDAPEGEKTI